MGWSKVNSKTKKPFGWWYHKIMCEIGWCLRKTKIGWKMYYDHLNIMCSKYKINIYGQRI